MKTTKIILALSLLTPGLAWAFGKAPTKPHDPGMALHYRFGSCSEFITYVFGPVCKENHEDLGARSFNPKLLKTKLNPLLKSGADMTERDAAGNNILHAVCHVRARVMLKEIVKHNSKLLELRTQTNLAGQTPYKLYLSSCKGKTDEVFQQYLEVPKWTHEELEIAKFLAASNAAKK